MPPLPSRFFSVKRLPRYSGGQREIEVELQYTSGRLGKPSAVWQRTDAHFASLLSVWLLSFQRLATQGFRSATQWKAAAWHQRRAAISQRTSPPPACSPRPFDSRRLPLFMRDLPQVPYSARDGAWHRRRVRSTGDFGILGVQATLRHRRSIAPRVSDTHVPGVPFLPPSPWPMPVPQFLGLLMPPPHHLPFLPPFPRPCDSDAVAGGGGRRRRCRRHDRGDVGRSWMPPWPGE